MLAIQHYLYFPRIKLLLKLITLFAALTLAGCNVAVIDDSYDNEIDIAWSFSADYSTARVYYSTQKGSAVNGQLVGQGRANVIGGHITHRGLTNGVRYYYVVKFYDATGTEGFVTPEVSGVPGTHIAGRYRTTGANREIVEDVMTGIQWQRCSEGQSWMIHSRDCRGDASRFTWGDASSRTRGGGWRAPSLNELSTLQYCSNLPLDQIGTGNCGNRGGEGPVQRPQIYKAAFPNTVAGGLFPSRYWTSTRNSAVDFNIFGVMQNEDPSVLGYLRLARPTP